MKPLRSPLALVLLSIVLALAVLFHRTWRLGEVFSPADIVFSFYPWAYDAPLTPMTNPTRSDEAFFHQPLMHTHWQRLRQGEWPDFEPEVLAGVPAFFQGLDVGRAFSPLSLPFYLLPAHVAVTVYAPLRLLTAALCMWIYLRSLGLGSAACASGALAWGLNGAFMTWLSAPMPTVALFLPAAWRMVDRVCSASSSASLKAEELATATSRDHQPTRDGFDSRWSTPWRATGGLAIVLGLVVLGAYIPSILACLFAVGCYALALVGARGRWSVLPKLVTAGIIGLLIGAVALVPMFDNLRTSPVSSRSMEQAYLPWANLATFFVPKFWGSPVSANWWYPGVGNYPEFVTYLGASVVMLGAVGWVAWRMAGPDPRRVVLALLGSGSLAMMYGWPPVTWLAVLPGFKQMSPLRWNVVLAACTSVFAAWGVHWLGEWTSRRMVGQSRWRAILPGVMGLGVLGALALAAAVALFMHLPSIRALGLQPFLRRELAWALGVSSLTGLAVLIATVARWRAAAPDGALHARLANPSHAAPRQEVVEGAARPLPVTIAAGACVVLIGCDLVRASMGFNPTLPPARLYPTTPAIEFLQENVPPHRFAPVGPGGELVNAHVWSVFSLPSVTGLDFYGDGPYQEFLAAADGVPFGGAKWEYIGLRHPENLDLKLLGVLSVSHLALSPTDVGTAVGGYLPLVELTSGRLVRQSFDIRATGLRRVDVLTGTYDRVNDGAVVVTLVDDGTGELVARREVAAANLPSNDWLTLEFDARADSAGRRYTLEVRSEGASTPRAAMLWSAVAAGNALPPVVVDGEPADRVLWIRTFSTPARIGDAPLVYGRDLNVYRNPHSLPRAWFARTVMIAPREQHLSRLVAQTFDTRTEVVVEERPEQRATPRGQVTTIDVTNGDARRISVDAPDGGVLVIGDRWHVGWRATVDGVPATVLRANSVLMAVAVPPGGRDVRLEFTHPLVRPSMAISAVATLAAVALLLGLVPFDRRRP